MSGPWEKYAPPAQKPWEKYAGDAAPVVSTAPAEAPGLLARSRQRLATGLGDVADTVIGNTYGYHGDPTERDNLTNAGKLLKAAGGDAIPAIGDVVIDSVITGGKAVLPKSAQEAIKEGVNSVVESKPARYLGKGLEAWQQASPESYAIAGQAANMASALMPVKKPVLASVGRNKRALDASMKLQRRKELLRRFEPEKSDVLDYGKPVENSGFLKRNEFEPNDYFSGVIDELEDIPDVNSMNSHTANIAAIDDRVSQVNEALIAKLKTAPPVSTQTIDDAMLAAQARAADQTLLAGDAASPASRLYEKFNRIMADHIDEKSGTVRPEDLLKVRRELDSFVRKAKMADPFTESGKAANVAVREMRNAVNDLVAQADPSVGVMEDLGRMNKLLTAEDIVRPRSLDELNTNKLTRSLRAMEEKTGIRHPVTPKAVKQNVLDPVVSLGLGVTALGANYGKAAINKARYGAAYMDNLLANVVRKGVPAAQKAAWISVPNMAGIEQEKNK